MLENLCRLFFPLSRQTRAFYFPLRFPSHVVRHVFLLRWHRRRLHLDRVQQLPLGSPISSMEENEGLVLIRPSFISTDQKMLTILETENGLFFSPQLAFVSISLRFLGCRTFQGYLSLKESPLECT